MKLVRSEKMASNDRIFVFQMSRQERDCLLAVLESYPMLDAYIQPISKKGGVNPESQVLLEEAMKELRVERNRKLREFVKDKPRIKREVTGKFRLTVGSEDREWLLQILNEIRVACWIRLGRPDTHDLSEVEMTPEALRTRTTMDLCGYFQAELLEASE